MLNQNFAKLIIQFLGILIKQIYSNKNTQTNSLANPDLRFDLKFFSSKPIHARFFLDAGCFKGH